MQVLVTGGAGYVGSHVCKALARRGHVPVTLDDMSHGHAAAVKWGPREVADIADTRRLIEACRQHAITAIVHLAAVANATEAAADPVKCYRTNVAGTISVLEAAKAAGIGQLVFASSGAVYGVPETTPTAEASRRQPTSPYGWSKLMAEQVIADAVRADGLNAIALRYFNASGADPDGELGELHEPETHLVPLVMQVASGRRSHVGIYGGKYRTPDGSCIRDYVDVTDLADAHVRALGALEGEPQFRAYNLGTGRGRSVKEVLETARRVTGRAIPAKIEEPRPGDAPVLVADPTLAEKELGWVAKRKDLTTMLASAWRWEQSRRAMGA